MPNTWGLVLALSAGGVLGVQARYWLGYLVSRWVSGPFPWATFGINVSGSFAIGLLSVLLARWLPHPNARIFLVVGFLGGYTTFSTFALDGLTLLERGEFGLAVTYLAGSTVAGLVAVALGVGLGRLIVTPRNEPAARAAVATLAPRAPGLPAAPDRPEAP